MVCVSEASVGGSEGLWGPRRWASLGLAIVVGALRSQLDFYPRYVHRERVVTYGQRVAVARGYAGEFFDFVILCARVGSLFGAPDASAGVCGTAGPPRASLCGRWLSGGELASFFSQGRTCNGERWNWEGVFSGPIPIISSSRGTRTGSHLVRCSPPSTPSLRRWCRCCHRSSTQQPRCRSGSRG